MKDDYNKNRLPYCYMILLILFGMAFSYENGYARTEKVVYDSSVCNFEKKTCFPVYCHSNGRGDYREISWNPPTAKLNCNGCHDVPSKAEYHKGVYLKICGQRCHRETIKNGYTTSFHINGTVDVLNEGIQDLIKDERDCLKCHYEPQGIHPDQHRGIPPDIGPCFKMSSNHLGGQPMNHDCKVCHMEEYEEFHENRVIELKNHNLMSNQDRQYYTLDHSNQLEHIYQFNQFCQDCHSTGESLLGINPFSTARPIPFILNEILYREVAPDRLEHTRFWYSHNHIAADLFNGEQGMNHNSPDSITNNLMGTLMDNGFNSQEMMKNSGPNSMFKEEMKAFMGSGMEGSGGSKQRRRMGGPGGGIGGGMPLTITGPVPGIPLDPILGSNPAAMIASQPTPIASVPLMGGGIAPSLGVPGAMPVIPLTTIAGAGMISQQIPGVLPLLTAIAPGGGISMLPGIEAMNIMRSGPGPMIMGPGIMPLVDPGLMIMAPIMRTGILPMTGPMIMDPGAAPVTMIMDPMLVMDPMRMGPMIMDPMMVKGHMRMGPMNMYPMTTKYLSRMAPINLHQYKPQHTNNTKDIIPPTHVIPDNGTTLCSACHTHEDPNIWENSLIIKCYHGHFSHQNCFVCHMPHGSNLPGLLKDGINWNRQNRSCNVPACHKPYEHKPPLEGTMVNYEIKPGATCNVGSCHEGSIHKGGLVEK